MDAEFDIIKTSDCRCLEDVVIFLGSNEKVFKC